MVMSELLPTLRAAARAAADKKAFQIKILEVSELTSYADNFLICSGASERQVAAIGDELQRSLRQVGRRPLHVEGGAGADWILLDYGELVIHVLTEDKRDYYKLDALWADAKQLELEPLLGEEGAAHS